MTSTLADHLRAASDDELGALLQLRPDLAIPVPADLSQLAGRVQSRVSVARALDGLDRFTLEVLDGLRYVRGEDGIAPVGTLLTLAAEAGADATQVRAALARLRALHLVYGSDGQLRLVGAINELLGPNPAGLGRPAARLLDEAEHLPGIDIVTLAADPAGLRRALLSAPPEARAVLDRLAEGPPVGQVALRSLTETSPLRWLLDHGLLVAIADDLVELPREVGLVLRRDAGPLGALHATPPPLEGRARPGSDQAGAGQAMDAVRHLDALLGVLAEAPPPVLRTGGLGVRDLRRLAKATGLDEASTALLLEIAAAAGLLTTGPMPGSVVTSPYGGTITREGGPDIRWLPTLAYDTWRAGPIARQWVVLARTWLSMTRAPTLVGQRDDRDKVINTLTVEVVRASAPGIRRSALDVLVDQSESTAVDADAVVGRLAWRYPRRYGRQGAAATDMHARAALREAATLGVTGLDAITSYGRVLLAERPDEDDDPLGVRAEPDPLVAALDRLLPAPVDHMLVQADLTVIIPGPPEPTLAAELAAAADAESRGGATVYRVTPTSIRRALDAGYASADLHALFARRSRTPLPQTLSYLIDDVARRHGGLRVGTAGAYLRGDDEKLLAEVLADRRLSGLALRRLAPTVLATAHHASRLLDVLRDAGYAPVAEDANGAVVLTRPTAARAPTVAVRLTYHVEDPERARLTGPRLAGVVEQIRRGDRIARAARRSPLATTQVGPDAAPVNATQAHAQALAVLRQGITERRKVWVGFVDAHGANGSRLVRPVSMGGGFLHAEDDRSQTRHTFALHRITAAALDS
ncbi:MAG TPA: helicase-associated domain-containing protein [Micromonosporaceae bacterium]|jgi:hypothetical protein